jgi:hypothetical protein
MLKIDSGTTWAIWLRSLIAKEEIFMSGERAAMVLSLAPLDRMQGILIDRSLEL